MPLFRRFLSRRCLLSLAAVAALLFGLAMLHPYPRQSLFGPTIRGRPWCVWEDAVRREAIGDAVHRGERAELNSFMTRTLRLFGVKHERLGPAELYNHEEMLPVLLAMVNDPDVEVRRRVLDALIWCDQLGDPSSSLPLLRERLKDVDADCRI